MRTGFLTCLGLLFVVTTVALGQPDPPADLHAMVVGVGSSDRVRAAGVPLMSGSWGTDYITVSHGLRVGRQFAVTEDGKTFSVTSPVAACSSQHHGIDVLILRVASHQNRPIVEWGDPADLKAGDELLMLPRREFHPGGVTVKFIATNLLEWAKSKPEDWPREWHNVMVGDGITKDGFSGSPWVRNRKVYGLHKGRVRPRGDANWHLAAETSTSVQKCLEQLRYQELVPKG